MGERLVPVFEARRVLGVSYITLWRWIREGRIRAVKSPTGRWLIPVSEIERLARRSDNVRSVTRVAIYARVSSRKQAEQGDLDRQVEVLRRFAEEHGYEVVAIIKDVGSGLKEDRPGLRKLFKLVIDRRIDAVLVTYRDRLTRFGFDYLRFFFESYGVSIIEAFQEENEPIEELVEDFLAIVTSFAGRIYGRRSHKAKRLIEENKRLVEEALRVEASQ